MSHLTETSLDLDPGEDVPVDAVCTGCQEVSVKWTEADDEGAVPASFQHVCHTCQTVQWYNVVAVLEGLYRSRGGERR